jgi:hypothetical protein
MTFRSSTSFTTMSGLALPAGTVSTDIVVLTISDTIDIANRPYTCPGWTLITENPATPSVGGISMYWALGSVASLAFVDAVSNPVTTQYGVIESHSGISTSTPIRSYSTLATADSNVFTTAPTGTASAGDDLIVAMTQQAAAAYGSAVGSPTLTDILNGNDGSITLAVGYASSLSAGTTTAYTRTSTAYQGRWGISLILASIPGVSSYYLSDMVEM